MAEDLGDIYAAMASFSGVSEKVLASRHNLRSTWHERFTAWHLMRRHHPALRRNDLDHVVTGAADDNQIDALLVLANGEPVYDPAEATALVAGEPIDTLALVFLQSTTTDAFRLQKMQATVMGTCHFFQEPPSLDENEHIQARREIVRILMGPQARGPTRVQVTLYYAALGRGMDDNRKDQRAKALQFRESAESVIQDRLDAWVREHEGFVGDARKPVVERPHVELVNVNKLRSVMQQNDGPHDPSAAPDPAMVPRTIVAEHLVPMPATPPMKAGFIGYVRGRDYLELLQSDDGTGLLDELSSRNVRRFLGTDNAVNREIAETLRSSSRDQFLVRNNGVTIVARDAELSRGRLRLHGYQIVNGLQTSHILYENRERVARADDVYVAMKVIVTEDEALAGAVSRSTNRQTDIADLQAERASPIVVRIARAFDQTREPGPGLWLERQPGEHDDVPEEDANRVVELDELVLAMGATVFAKPHWAAGHPAQIHGMVPAQILNDTDQVPVYVAVGTILHRIREYVAASDIEDRFRFHLAWGLYEFVRPVVEPSALSDRRWVAGASAMMEALSEPETVAHALKQVMKSFRDQTRKFDLASPLGRRIHKEARRVWHPFRQSVRDKVEATRP